MRPKKQGILAHPLNAVLGREANIRVLRELVVHGGYLSSTEVTRRARLTKMSALTSLRTLELLQIVETAGSRTAILHKVSDNHPFSACIVALFEAEAGRTEAIFRLVGENMLHAVPDAAGVWVYGSVARNEDGPGSDLDVAVVLRDDRNLQRVQEDVQSRMAALGETQKFRPSVVLLNENEVRRLAEENDTWWQAVSAEAKTIVGETPSGLLLRLKRKSRNAHDTNRIHQEGTKRLRHV